LLFPIRLTILRSVIDGFNLVEDAMQLEPECMQKALSLSVKRTVKECMGCNERVNP